MNTEAFTTAAGPTKNTAPKQSTTLTVRLSQSEREQLDHLAGDRPVSAFVRSRLFGKQALKDLSELRRDFKRITQNTAKVRAQQRRHPCPVRSPLGAKHHLWQPRARHRHPEQ